MSALRSLLLASLTLLLGVPLVLISPTVAQATPFCEDANSDPDGDGWGWENNQSCLVQDEPAPSRFCPRDPSGLDWDTDGDGWGWHNNASCKVQFPRAVDQETEDWLVLRLRRSSSSNVELSTTQKREVAQAAVAAYGNRRALIDRWINESGAYVNWRSGTVSSYKCPTIFRRGRMYLVTTNRFVVVHEIAHALDCSGNGTIDGLPKYMSSADRNALAQERNRLVEIYNNTGRTIPPAGLRNYSFTNREEFFADVAAYFLTSPTTRFRMAEEAPLLYDTLRNYFEKDNWPAAADVERT